MADEKTNQIFEQSAREIKQEARNQGKDLRQLEAYKNASWLKKFAMSLGLEGLYDNVEDYLTGKWSQKREYELDLDKLKREQDWEKYMWDKANKYNSTPEQLARWTRAGGNPNAFFGGGTNTGNAPMTSSPTGGPGAGNTIGLLQGGINATAGAIKSWWENRKLKAEAEGKEIENGTLWEINQATLDEIRARAEQARKAGRLSDMETKQIEELLPGLKGKTNAEWDKIKEETNNLIEQRKVIKQQVKNLRADTRNKILQNEKLEWEKLFRDQYGVDPNAGPIQMLIQNILTGKGTNVLDAIFNWLEGGGESEEGVLDEIDNIVTEKTGHSAGKMARTILYGNPGLAGALYSYHENKRRKQRWKERGMHAR